MLNKKNKNFILALVLTVLCLFPAPSYAAMPYDVAGVHEFYGTGTIEVAFSPKGGITNMIIDEINRAGKSVYVQAYSFTSPEITDALIGAQERGIDVAVIVDKSQETAVYTAADDLSAAGVPVHTDKSFAIAHSKIMIIDGVNVVTGSFNFTKSAENSNAENCLVLKNNREIAELYMKNWLWRWGATQSYIRK